MKAKVNAKRKGLDKDDKIVYVTSHSMGIMTYYAIEFLFGFKEKRLRRFYAAIQSVKDKWAEGSITSEELLRYSASKKIDVYGWLKSIPTQYRLKLGQGNYSPLALKYIDSAMLTVVLMSVVILKEEFKVSTPGIEKYLAEMKGYIESYAIKQPGIKDTYLSDKMILDYFKREMSLDLETGEKVELAS